MRNILTTDLLFTFREKPFLMTRVEIIYDAGGIPVMAHPHDLENAAVLIKDLMHMVCGGLSLSQKTFACHY